MTNSQLSCNSEERCDKAIGPQEMGVVPVSNAWDIQREILLEDDLG